MKRAVALMFAITTAACSRAAPDATPDGALRLFLDDMEASSETPGTIHDAWALLGPDAKKNLEERARRTGQLQGRRVEPYQMLAEGRFGLRFRPKAMKATVAGDRATVEVYGDDPRDHASVRCVRERDRAAWRVEPELPEPPAPAAREGQ